MAGYSGTPLIRKLGLVPGPGAVVIDPPRPYGALLDTDIAVTVLTAGDVLPPAPRYVHLFATRRDVLARVAAELRGALDPAGMFWVSWPKKAAKVATDITEDGVRELCLPLGFVDVKVCAVDAVWSGLKLMIRRTLR